MGNRLVGGNPALVFGSQVFPPKILHIALRVVYVVNKPFITHLQERGGHVHFITRVQKSEQADSDRHFDNCLLITHQDIGVKDAGSVWVKSWIGKILDRHYHGKLYRFTGIDVCYGDAFFHAEPAAVRAAKGDIDIFQLPVTGIF